MQAESGFLWTSVDTLREIVIGNGEVLLINSRTGESTKIGNTIDEAIKRLIDFGMDEDFPDFIHEYNG